MRERLSSRSTLIPVAAVALLLVSFFLAAGMHRVLTVIPDDAAYYFKIAQNVSEGAGLTFDRINRTNGFHPLWLYLLVPVYRFVHGSPETMCRIVLVFATVLLAAAGLLLNSYLARSFSRRAVVVSLLVFTFFVFIPGANGMESAVLVLILAALLVTGSAAGIFWRSGGPGEAGFGALLGFLVLSRLDMVFVPLVVLAYAFVRAVASRGRRWQRLAQATFVLGGFAAVVSPYLIYNRVSFGAVMPISGALKSSFPAVTLSGYALTTLGKRGWLGVLMALGYLVWRLARRGAALGERGEAGYFRTAMSLMALAIVLHFLYAVFFMKWAIFNWHYIPYAFFGAVMICEPMNRLLSRADSMRSSVLYWSVVTVLVVLGVVTAARNLNQSPDRNWRIAAYDAARWVRQNTAREAVLAMKDAGNLGYFSERRVINLDGVVNNLEYQAALRTKSLESYLAIKGVRYYVQHAFWDRPDVSSGDYDSYAVSFWSHRFESASDSLVLRRADEVYRSRPYFDGPIKTALVIWKLPPVAR
ncbi:MAG TPA: hypothetical protein VMT60_04260 [Candidatus Bathyarchaeia archaeon]|nr:hypothetical protein [Candidatus Bathyarchaeia archaeon]